MCVTKNYRQEYKVGAEGGRARRRLSLRLPVGALSEWDWAAPHRPPPRFLLSARPASLSSAATGPPLPPPPPLAVQTLRAVATYAGHWTWPRLRQRHEFFVIRGANAIKSKFNTILIPEKIYSELDNKVWGLKNSDRPLGTTALHTHTRKRKLHVIENTILGSYPWLGADTDEND